MILQVCLPNPCKTKVTLSNEGKLDIPFWCNRVLEIAHIYIYIYIYIIYIYINIYGVSQFLWRDSQGIVVDMSDVVDI